MTDPRRGRGRRRLAVIAVLIAGMPGLAQPAGAAAPSPQIAQRTVGLWTPGAANGLAYDALIHRVINDIPATRNVAVFRYELPNGELRTLAIDSHKFTRGGGRHRGEGHSEERLEHILRRWGVDPGWVVEIYSELEPCSLPGHNCRGMLNRTYPRLRSVTWSLPYPYDRDQRQQSRQIRSQSIGALSREAAELRRRYTLPGGRRSLPVLTPRFIPKLPGGIDFSTLELRYVKDAGRGGLRYAFRGQPAAGASDPAVGRQTTGQASDALFTWLALPPSAFWVNLNPNEPDRVIDPRLARTDAGRVLLEADLLLKKTTVGLMNPDTSIGDPFWDELERIYGDRAHHACVSLRVWIVPEPATVREDGDELYILDAPLTVNVETIALPVDGVMTCPQESPAVEAAKEQLVRALIMPAVIHAVNTAPAYEPLRRVYMSRVAAEWLRQRSARRRTAVAPVVGSGEVDRWAARTPWDPQEVFARYVGSIRNGEWTARREVEVGDVVYERTLIQGGVDFSRTPRQGVSRREFRTRWPAVAERVERAQRRPVTAPDAAWLGGGGASSAALGRVRLRLRTPDRRVRGGERVRFRLRVANPTAAPVRDVRVCDRLPADLRHVRSNRRHRVQAGWHCWQIRRIGARRARTIRFDARVRRGARGRAVSRAVASVRASASASRTRSAVRVTGGRAGRD